ncbi:MAG: transporter [Mycetocola sp.]
MTLEPTARRFPLNTLAIAFGLAGLANVWAAATTALHLFPLVVVVTWLVAATAWVWLIVAHLYRGRRSPSTLLSQLRDPIQGPIAALVPIVGTLLAAALRVVWVDASTVLVIFFVGLTGIFAAWLLSMWLRGGFNVDSVHGGYFLPTVAGGYISAIAASEVGLHSIAVGAFAVGTFFWAVMFVLIAARLMFRPPLPAPLVPTMAIFVAPPAVAGTAWSLIVGTSDGVAVALAGVTVLMLLVQLSLIPFYRLLPFSLGFWSFTFSFAAVAADAIGWFERLHPWGWQALVVAFTTVITALVAGIAAKSIQLWYRQRPLNIGAVTSPRPLNRELPIPAAEVAASIAPAMTPQRGEVT